MKTAASVVLASALMALFVLFAFPRLAVEWARWTDPGVIFAVPVQGRVVALSIDDGPSSATPEILALLEKHDARATFFLIGEKVKARPEMARDIVAAGHEVGHHMMEDRPSWRLTEDEFEARFDAADRLLHALGGARVFRPGGGWYSERMVRAAAERGYRTVLGSVYPFDTVVPFTGLLAWYILRSTVPGSILILHDGPERGLRTAAVLRTVLPELRSRGYEVVTVSRLLALAEGGEPDERPSASGRTPAATPDRAGSP